MKPPPSFLSGRFGLFGWGIPGSRSYIVFKDCERNMLPISTLALSDGRFFWGMHREGNL